jgi:hypothetical protein
MSEILLGGLLNDKGIQDALKGFENIETFSNNIVMIMDNFKQVKILGLKLSLYKLKLFESIIEEMINFSTSDNVSKFSADDKYINYLDTLKMGVDKITEISG